MNDRKLGCVIFKTQNYIKKYSRDQMSCYPQFYFILGFPELRLVKCQQVSKDSFYDDIKN